LADFREKLFSSFPMHRMGARCKAAVLLALSLILPVLALSHCQWLRFFCLFDIVNYILIDGLYIKEHK